MNHGPQLRQGHQSCGVDAQGEDQLIAGFGTTFEHRTVEHQLDRFIALGIDQPGVRRFDHQFVDQRTRAVGTIFGVEGRAEVAADRRIRCTQIGLVHLQRHAPGHVGIDVVVVIIRSVGEILPILVAWFGVVLQVRAARVELGAIEQHVGTASTGQWHASQQGLPVAISVLLEGQFGAIAERDVGRTIGDDEETHLTRVEPIQIEGGSRRLRFHISPDHLAHGWIALGISRVIAVAVVIAGIAAEEGGLRLEARLHGLDGRGVIVDRDNQLAHGGITITVGHGVADLQFDVVFVLASRMHQGLMQLQLVLAERRIGQHHGHQRVALGTADGQRFAVGVPGRGNVLGAQHARPGQRDATQTIRASVEYQRAGDRGVRPCYVALTTVDAIR